jgi:hypothetical protein
MALAARRLTRDVVKLVHDDWQERVVELNRRHAAELERRTLAPAYLERLKREEVMQRLEQSSKPTAATQPQEQAPPPPAAPAEYTFKAKRGADGKIDLNSVVIRRVEAA